MEVHFPDNPERIDRLYVVMSVDAEGRNGICATLLPELGAVPMVTGNRVVARHFLEEAQKYEGGDKRLGLFVFTREGELESDEL